MNLTMRMRSAYRFYVSTPIQRDPNRWLYKKCYAYVKCSIENRQNAYSNYFASLKSGHNPESPCNLNKFDKFNIEQAFKIREQINKLLAHESVRQHVGYLQSLIEEHRKAKLERKEYTKCIQSLDNGHDLKPFEEEPAIKRLKQMRKEYETICLRKNEEVMARKKMEDYSKNTARLLKQEQKKKELRTKIDKDERPLESCENSNEPATDQQAEECGKPRSYRKSTKPRK